MKKTFLNTMEIIYLFTNRTIKLSNDLSKECLELSKITFPESSEKKAKDLKINLVVEKIEKLADRINNQYKEISDIIFEIDFKEEKKQLKNFFALKAVLEIMFRVFFGDGPDNKFDFMNVLSKGFIQHGEMVGFINFAKIRALGDTNLFNNAKTASEKLIHTGKLMVHQKEKIRSLITA